MTNEEMYDTIRLMKSYAEDRGFQDAVDMYDVELKALEKQIPKPVIHCIDGFDECSVCGEAVARNAHYCEMCGQRLEEED